MPSPFPGMDPFVEGVRWASFHHMLSAEMVRQLNPRLRPRYAAGINERFVLELPEEVTVETPTSLRPVVGVSPWKPQGPRISPTSTLTAPLQLPTVMPARVRQLTVVIRDTTRRRLVTAIEVFSPTNKQGGGRKEYLKKRRNLLLTDVHLIEVDLLRQGKRVPMRKPLPDAPYFVLVGRSENRPLFDVWPIGLEERLPTVPVPLLEGDADVPLDLQAAFNAVYDELALDVILDYTQPPTVPVSPQEKTWLDDLLKASGKR